MAEGPASDQRDGDFGSLPVGAADADGLPEPPIGCSLPLGLALSDGAVLADSLGATLGGDDAIGCSLPVGAGVALAGAHSTQKTFILSCLPVSRSPSQKSL